jgi:hypothetical protein
MGYSNKRLVVFGIVWGAAVLFVFSGSSTVVESPLEEADIGDTDAPILETAIAQYGNPSDNSCQTEGPPCAFPAENYNGGITLGAKFLEAANGGLTFFNPQTASGDNPGDRRLDTKYLPPNAADKDQDFVEVATLGLDVQQVRGFFLHKTWKTGPSVPNHDNAYIYIQTQSAKLEGPSGGGEVGCRESPYVKQHCDLVAPISELAAGGLCFGGSALGGGVGDTKAFFRETRTGTSFGSTQCDNLADDGSSSYPDNGCANVGRCDEIGYWVEEPQTDVCEINQIVDLSLGGATIQGFCLSAADPEATFDFADVIPFTFAIDTIEIDDLLIRSHLLKAEQGPTTGENKILQLGEDGDPDNNFYAEIRWGKGYDRALWPDSNIRSDYDWLDNEVDDGQSLSDQTRVAGLAVPFPCRGNPTAENQGWASQGPDGDANANCNIDAANSGALEPGPYDDIYR